MKRSLAVEGMTAWVRFNSVGASSSRNGRYLRSRPAGIDVEATADRHADDFSSVAGETTVTREMSVDSTERRAVSWTYISSPFASRRACNLVTAALGAADSGRDQCAPSASSQPDRGGHSGWHREIGPERPAVDRAAARPVRGRAEPRSTMVSTPAAAAMPSWRRSTPAMSTGWSPPGTIAPAISPGATRLCCATRNSK